VLTLRASTHWTDFFRFFIRSAQLRIRADSAASNAGVMSQIALGIPVLVWAFGVLFLQLFWQYSAVAESRMIYGVPFGLTSLESVSEGTYEVEVLGRTSIAPAEKIDQIIFDTYFNSPLGTSAAALPGLPAPQLRAVVLGASEKGDVENAIVALKKFVRQIDVKSSDTVALLTELLAFPGRDVLHQFLSAREALVIEPTALAPLLTRMLTDDAEFLRNSSPLMMEKALAAVRRRFVSEGLAQMLRDPSKAEMDFADQYGLVYGITDDGNLDLGLLREEIANLWRGAKVGDLGALSLVSLLQEQAEVVLVPEEGSVFSSFILLLAEELERAGKIDAAVRVLTLIPFNRRTPDIHGRIARLLKAFEPGEQSILLNDDVRSVLFNYAIVDEEIRSALLIASEGLVRFLLEREETQVAQGIVKQFAERLGGWTPQLVAQTLNVAARLNQQGFPELARRSLAMLQGRVGLAAYPKYIWLRLVLGASFRNIAGLLIYLSFVALLYRYIQRLNATRSEAMQMAFKEGESEPERPRFVQYWHQSSPLLAEYLRNLEILELRPGASPNQIKQRYREGLRRLRQILDKGRDLKATEELMKIQAAFRRIQEIESNPLFSGLLREMRGVTGPKPDNSQDKPALKPTEVE
jgi:hypothetical protein